MKLKTIFSIFILIASHSVIVNAEVETSRGSNIIADRIQRLNDMHPRIPEIDENDRRFFMSLDDEDPGELRIKAMDPQKNAPSALEELEEAVTRLHESLPKAKSLPKGASEELAAIPERLERARERFERLDARILEIGRDDGITICGATIASCARRVAEAAQKYLPPDSAAPIIAVAAPAHRKGLGIMRAGGLFK